MKILALIEVAPDAQRERIRHELVAEVGASWQLFTAGLLREAYATESPGRIVFVLEAEDVDQTEEQLRALPLVGAGLFQFELIGLLPFANWSVLFRV